MARIVTTLADEGVYLAILYRFHKQIKAGEVTDVPMRLDFKPGEAAQIGFGAGPTLNDVHT